MRVRGLHERSEDDLDAMAVQVPDMRGDDGRKRCDILSLVGLRGVVAQALDE